MDVGIETLKRYSVAGQGRRALQHFNDNLKIAQRFNAGVKRKLFFQVPKWTTEILA